MPLLRLRPHPVVLSLAAAMLTGCFLDRTPIIPPASLEVEPQYFCPDDPVEVRWDARRLPRHPSFCAALGDAFSEPIACTSNAECPADAVCRDGFCCPRSVSDGNADACPNASGCVAPFELTITGDPEAIVPPIRETGQLRGSRTLTPSRTTTYTMEVSYTGASEPVRDSDRAQMVTVDPATAHATPFPFACLGTGPGYYAFDMDSPQRFASEHVRIEQVRNTSANIIEFGGGTPGRPEVTLRPGESTDALNGPARGRWTIRLSPLDPAALRRPRCGPTDVADPWPDLEVEWLLVCAVDP